MRRSNRARRRATAMLEFALILPLMLFMLAFCIDLGRMMYTAHAAQQALADAARQAAVFGAAGIGGSSTDAAPGSRQIAIDGCNTAPASCQMALYALHSSLKDIPGGQNLKSWTLSVEKEQALGLGDVCTADTPSIKLALAYEIKWLMPGMNALLSVDSKSTTPALEPQKLVTKAVVRCEAEDIGPVVTGAP